eukprot:scaffold3228_cov384-Prasinococcus_capsulatus_cf.AAC.8
MRRAQRQRFFRWHTVRRGHEHVALANDDGFHVVSPVCETYVQLLDSSTDIGRACAGSPSADRCMTPSARGYGLSRVVCCIIISAPVPTVARASKTDATKPAPSLSGTILRIACRRMHSKRASMSADTRRKVTCASSGGQTDERWPPQACGKGVPGR